MDAPTDEDGIPVLREVPKERWREVLRSLPHRTRKLALGRVGRSIAPEEWVLLAELELEDPGPIAIRTPSVPAGQDVAVASPSARQVNLKLDAEHHDRLSTAAHGVGLRPTALARLLVVRGVDEMLRSR